MLALMYPWATKEYVLWQMSLGQVIMYLNVGMDIKAGKDPKRQRTQSDLREAKAEINAMFPELRAQYGDIDG